MADHHESYMLNSTPMYPPPGGVHYPSPAHQHPYPPPGAYHYTGGKPQPPTATYPANTSVVVQPATHVHSNIDGYIILSCIVYWCCNLIFGAIAFIMAMAARDAMLEGDLRGAKHMGKWSLWMSIVGVILTVVLVLILIILLFTGVIWNAAFDGAYHIP